MERRENVEERQKGEDKLSGEKREIRVVTECRE